MACIGCGEVAIALVTRAVGMVDVASAEEFWFWE
jgi:hypothetical protein